MKSFRKITQMEISIQAKKDKSNRKGNMWVNNEMTILFPNLKR